MNSKHSLGVYFFFPAITMLLGWGLRGTIGGGPIGALIPGAMVALALCLLLGRRESAGLIVCLGALGIGMGGHVTYGQTIGLSRFDDTYWWGSLGMATKGAVWGLMGGGILGLAFVRDKFTNRQIMFAMIAMVAGCYVGWAYIDVPRHSYFYFSDPEKPRAEIWAGLLLGAIAFLSALAASSDNKIPLRFAMWGLLFGGLGFGLGGQLIAMGVRLDQPLKSFSWWKGMEFSFGFLLGGGLGLAAYVNRHELGEPTIKHPELVTKDSPFLPALFMAAILVLTVHRLHFTVPVLFIMAIECAVLTGLVLYSNFFGWQIGVTLTTYSFGLDLIRAVCYESKTVQFSEEIRVWWVLVIVMSLGTAVAVALNFRKQLPAVKPILLLLTWTGVFVGMMKMYLLSHPNFDKNYFFVSGTFLVSAILTSVLALMIPEPHAVDIEEIE